MKKLFIILFLALQTYAVSAQNDWQVPEKQTATSTQTQTQKSNTPRKALFEKKAKKAVDARYLAGAVPEVDGKVVFTADKDFPGQSADQLYSRVYKALQQIVDSDNTDASMNHYSEMALMSKSGHAVVARYKEWMVFKKSALTLDRSLLYFQLVAQCSDGHIQLQMRNIRYEYEMDRGDAQGLKTTAENWITDKYALNKKGDKLYKYSGKFRIKTIDRKNELFSKIMAYVADSNE